MRSPVVPGVFRHPALVGSDGNSATTTAAASRGYTIGSRYIDPDTGSWALDDYKQFKRIEASLGWVYAMLMTERGSIEELPWFGSNLRRITHLGVGVTAKIESAIDEALRPFIGIKFDRYTRKAWLQNGAPLFSVEITVSGTTSAIEIPLSA